MRADEVDVGRPAVAEPEAVGDEGDALDVVGLGVGLRLAEGVESTAEGVGRAASMLAVDDADGAETPAAGSIGSGR
jgi:hypothetical protein